MKTTRSQKYTFCVNGFELSETLTTTLLCMWPNVSNSGVFSALISQWHLLTKYDTPLVTLLNILKSRIKKITKIWELLPKKS